MRSFYFIAFFLFLFGGHSFAQKLERKIIIENEIFYYITVDDNSQIATLYKGKLDQKLSAIVGLALPAGRGMSAETNPLAWDIQGNDLIAINFLDHVLNDRNESIKRISMADLQPWSSGIAVEEMVMKSVDQEMYALNEPYLFVKKRSKYLNHFYFDGIMIGDTYWMVMTNNDELTVWKYDGSTWQHSEVKKFPVTGFFHLIDKNEKPHLIVSTGAVYSISLNQMDVVVAEQTTFNLAEQVVIDDRDAGKIYSIKNNQLNGDKTLKEVLGSNAIELIKN